MEKEFLAPSDGKGFLRSYWWERSEETFKCHLRETKRSGDVFGKSRRSINIYNRPNVNEPMENIRDQKSWINKWAIFINIHCFDRLWKKDSLRWAILDEFFFSSWLFPVDWNNWRKKFCFDWKYLRPLNQRNQFDCYKEARMYFFSNTYHFLLLWPMLL